MREKYFEDLGLDDGINIFEKLNIDIDKIVEKKDDINEKDEKIN